MILLKSIFTTAGVIGLFLSANVFASDFIVDTSINDDLSDTYGGPQFEIYNMDIKWATNDQINVDIYTDFIQYNNLISASGSSNFSEMVFGDLLISTQGENTPYDYAFILSDEDRTSVFSTTDEDKHWEGQGTFTEIESTITSKDYHGPDSLTADGEVMAGITVGTGIMGDWSIDNYGNDNNQLDKISFSFNVNGIDAFKNASQLAFSWTMSCANDLMEGVVDVDRPISVPEPTTLLLMILSLGIIRIKHKGLSA